MSNLTAMRGNLVALRGNLVRLDARKPFIIKIDTTKGNGFNSFTLPLTNHTTDIYVNTSDGQRFTISNYLDPKRTIEFASAGVYTIELRGQCGWSFYNTGDCQKLTEVISWGDFLFNYLVGAFYGCFNLGLCGGLPLTGSINAPSVTSLEYTFTYCNLTNLNNGSMLQLCKNVTSLFVTFYGNQISSIHADLFKNQSKTTDFTSALEDNLLEHLPEDLFKPCVSAQTFFGALARNRFKSLPPNLFYYNKNVTNYYAVLFRAFTSDVIKCQIPQNMFDLTVLYKVVNFSWAFRCETQSNSPTGAVQDIWNYAPSATKTSCFQNCTGLTNYDDIPTDWI